MSGDGTGTLVGALLLLPIMAIGAAIAVAGAVVSGAVAAGRAVYNYSKRRREQIDIDCSKMSTELAHSFETIKDSIRVQNELAEIAYEKMLSNLENAADEVSSYTSNLTQASSKHLVGKIRSKQYEIETIINDNEEDISRNYHNAVSKSVDTAKADIKKHYSDLMTDIQKLAANTAARQTLAENYAKQAIENATQALEVLKNNYPENENIPMLEIKLNKSVGNLNMGMGEVAFSTAHSLVLDVLDKFVDADNARRKHDAKVAEILTLLEHIRAVLSKERYITFEYDGNEYTEDLAEFSSGEYRVLEDICSELSGKMSDDASDRMTQVQLAEVYKEVEQLSMDVNNMFEFAVQNLANAYQREDVSDVIVDSMEQQGFVFEGHVNRANNRGESLHMKFTNLVGEEIIVKLSPEDDPELGSVKTNIEVNMFNLSNPDDEHRKTYIRKQITDAITSEEYLGVRAASMSCKGISSHRNSTDHSVRDFERIKKMRVRKEE